MTIMELAGPGKCWLAELEGEMEVGVCWMTDVEEDKSKLIHS